MKLTTNNQQQETSNKRQGNDDKRYATIKSQPLFVSRFKLHVSCFMLQASHPSNPAFTLVELLIVIGILAVLATTTVLILNPAEIIIRANDTRRLNDLQTINQALSLYSLRAANPQYGSSTNVYISLPNTLSNCTGSPSYTLPPLPGTLSYSCSTEANYKKVDGTGWIPVDFTSLAQGNPLPVLPTDPVNNASQSLYYTYMTGGSWNLTSLLQSTTNHDQAINDGGFMPGVYELGTNLTLGPTNRDLGLTGYWKMDETTWINNCSTNTTTDSSGNSNHGKSCPNGTGPTGGATGKVDKAGSFDGVDDYVSVADKPDWAFGTNPFTIALWVNWNSLANIESIMGQSTGGGNVTKWTLIKNVNLSYGYNNTLMMFNFYDGVADRSFTWNWTANTSTWYHLAVTRSSNDWNLYINGTQTGGTQIQSSSVPNVATDLRIGSDGEAWNFFNGLIDDVRVYNRALSVAEISAIYNATK